MPFFIVAHIVKFSRDIGSASSFCSSSLRSSRSDYQCDQLFFPFDFVLIPFAHYQQSHPDLTRLLFVFFSFSPPPLFCVSSFPSHFGSFWLNSHDFCSSFHFIFSLPSRVYSRKIPKTRLRDFSQGSSDPITFSFSFTRCVYIFTPSARFGFCVGDSFNFTSLFEFSRVFLRVFPRSHFLLSSLRLLLSSSVSLHLTHSDPTFKIDPSLRSRRSVLIPRQRSAYLLLFGTRLKFLNGSLENHNRAPVLTVNTRVTN